jgi:hypothetical protein
MPILVFIPNASYPRLLYIIQPYVRSFLRLHRCRRKKASENHSWRHSQCRDGPALRDGRASLGDLKLAEWLVDTLADRPAADSIIELLSGEVKMTSAELEDDLSVAMEKVLDRYADAHSVDGASVNITMLSALFMAVADVFNRAIKDGNLPVCLHHAETEFAQLITLLTPMAQNVKQSDAAAGRRAKVEAVCKELRDTTKH